MLVKNIRAGADSSIPRNLTAVNGELFFSANDGIDGDELWKTDGTELCWSRISVQERTAPAPTTCRLQRRPAPSWSRTSALDPTDHFPEA